jgi:hypothetical protein
MKAVTKTKGFFYRIGDYLRKEQREFLFDRKSSQEEKEYFNFFKFFFNSPDKTNL